MGTIFNGYTTRMISSILVGTSNIVASMALIGYGLNLQDLYNWNFRTTYPMAFNTALCLWCTSMSVILIHLREKSE